MKITYHGKDIETMTTIELVNASFDLTARQQQVLDKHADPRFKKKMLNQPPPTLNPAFITLSDAIANEIKKREGIDNNDNS